MNEGIKAIEENATYKEVLADSFGGCIYNVANFGKYEGAEELLELWEQLTPSEKDISGGIMKGAMGFLKDGE